MASALLTNAAAPHALANHGVVYGDCQNYTADKPSLDMPLYQEQEINSGCANDQEYDDIFISVTYIYINYQQLEIIITENQVSNFPTPACAANAENLVQNFQSQLKIVLLQQEFPAFQKRYLMT